MTLRAKICGISTPEAVRAAVEGNAAYLGFVFFAGSPRNIAPGAPMVDVSSGVERGPGLKDPALITAFLDAVRRV